MGKSLRVLMIEDSEEDATLILRELKRGGFDCKSERVDTPEGLEAELNWERWDLVLCDYSMPRFSAPDALAIIKNKAIDVPFIIISGTVGEDTAVAAMRLGAHDYVLKGKLTRLCPAVEREVREAALRADRQRIREQLMTSDRMISLGSLASGVAHGVSEPLSAVLANLELLGQTLAQLIPEVRGHLRGRQSPVADWLETRIPLLNDPLNEARESADHVRQVVQDLKLISENERRGAVDVRRVLEAAMRLARYEARQRARIVEDYAEMPLVDGEEARLGQVFLSLILNAARTIPAGDPEHHEIRVIARCIEDGRVTVEVQDTAPLLTPRLQRRIFEPFVETGNDNTGLGLAFCKRVVGELGGDINVVSEGRGNVFRVVLSPAQVDMTVIDLVPVMRERRRGRIMVLAEDPLVASALHRSLVKEHDVENATDASIVLRRLGENERFDVLFCDLLNPAIGGIALHAEIMKVAPDQAERMVFMTGGGLTPAAREFLDRVPNARIEKPFNVANLRLMVQGLLR